MGWGRGVLLVLLSCGWSKFYDIYRWAVPDSLIDIVCNAVEFGASLRELCAEGSPGLEDCITHAGIYRYFFTHSECHTCVMNSFSSRGSRKIVCNRELLSTFVTLTYALTTPLWPSQQYSLVLRGRKGCQRTYRVMDPITSFESSRDAVSCF